LESKRLADAQTLRLTKVDQSIEAEQIRRVSHALAAKRLKIFAVSLVICLHAGSLERLAQRSRYLLSSVRTLHLEARASIRQHDQAWMTCMPLGLDVLQRYLLLPSDVCSP